MWKRKIWEMGSLFIKSMLSITGRVQVTEMKKQSFLLKVKEVKLYNIAWIALALSVLRNTHFCKTHCRNNSPLFFPFSLFFFG